MANPALAYALLKATYSENVHNPADAITPVIKRSLFRYGKEPIRTETLQKRIADLWGIEIPLNVIRYSLPRLASAKIVHLDTAHRYRMVDENYEDKDIIQLEKAAREKYARTVSRLNEVIVDIGLDNIDGTDVLDGWLDSSALSFLGGMNPASNVDKYDKKIQRIMSLALSSYVFSDEFAADLTDLCLGDFFTEP